MKQSPKECNSRQHSSNQTKKFRKPRTSRRKQQWYKVKKQKQTSIALAKQIESETTQCSWQEKTTTESTTKKLMLQFGFVADPTISTHHNASNTLATTPTWYYFSRPSNLTFHDFTKKHKPPKNLLSLLGLGLKFIPTPSLTNSWSDSENHPTTDCSTPYTCSFTSLENHQTKEPHPTTLNYMSNPNGHRHIGQSPPLLLKNAFHGFPKPLTNYSKHIRVKQTFYPISIRL